jgi:hypothetical protein
MLTKLFKLSLFSLMAFALQPNLSVASSIEDELARQYPADQFILGFGQAKITKSRNMDERIATITARALIAQQIKVRIKQEFVSTTTCENAVGMLFSKNTEICKKTVNSTIDQTVEEVLIGANPVKSGIDGSMVYVAVVLPIMSTSQKLEESVDAALQQAKVSLKSAKKGGAENFAKARDDYLKVKMLNQQREVLGGGRSNSEKAFQEMESELVKLMK